MYDQTLTFLINKYSIYYCARGGVNLNVPRPSDLNFQYTNFKQFDGREVYQYKISHKSSDNLGL